MIRVRVFGILRDLVGDATIELEVDESSVRDILSRIRLRDGGTLLEYVSEGNRVKSPYRIFINGVMIGYDKPLDLQVRDGDEVVVTPPVSAGGMVDITRKEFIYREAEARGIIRLRPETIKIVREGGVEKGDVYEASKISAIQAVKNTPSILPYCHPIRVTHVDYNMDVGDEYIEVRVRVKAIEQTGVEMEALTGVSAALLTIWDMVKKYEKDEEGNYPYTSINDIRVIYKVKGSPDEDSP